MNDEKPFVPCAPMIMNGEISPYQSPIDGRLINNKRERMDDFKRHDCIDAREVNPKRNKDK